MALNLLRNSRLFVTTNVDQTTGLVLGSGHTVALTAEVQVLEGFTFSQNSANEAITVSEAGTTPSRGQRSFNTSLAPVDFSFSTYMRPFKSTNIKSEDSALWNALASNTPVSATGLTKTGTWSTAAYTAATNTLVISGTSLSVTGLAVGDDVVVTGIGTAGAGTAADVKVVTGPARVTAITSNTSISFRMHNPGAADIISANLSTTAPGVNFFKSGWSETTTQAILGFHDSNRNQLQKMGLMVVVDNVTYEIDDATITQVTIDFGLDGIATAQWTGQARVLSELSASITTPTAGTFATGVTGVYQQKNTTASYITNKLSTATLKLVKALGGKAAGSTYYVALTGGSITISNNVTYITPANLGVVNLPAASFTGTRAISGSVTAYLNTGAVIGFADGGTGNLLKDMLAAAATAIEPMFAMEIAIGGSNNALRVELQMPSVSLAVPSVDTQAIVSTSLNFTAAASDLTGSATTSTYDLTRTNDLTIRYYAP